MELKNYFNFFLKSYLISFYFFNNVKKIVFLNKLKVNLFFVKNLNLRFIIFILLFFIFNSNKL